MNCFTFLFYFVWVKIYFPLGVYLWVKYIRFTRCLCMGTNICSIRCLFMGKNIRSTRCLFMGKIIRSNIDFLYVKGNRLFAHQLPIMLPPTGTYYLTYNVTFR